MKIFIIGGTGFIGKHLVKKLQEKKYNLLLLSPHPLKELPAILGDLSEINDWKPKLEEFKPDAALHLAWEGLPDYSSKTSIKNLKYGLDLFNLLAEIGCKTILSTGSCWEYGEQSGRLSEDTALKPLNAFTAAKNALHWLGEEIAKENNIQFIWTRIFYVYGPGQRETSFIPYLIHCTKTGKTPEIKNPSARNDFIYVKDVAEAIYMLLKNCRQSGVYNIGSGYLTGVQEIIKIIFDNFGLDYQYKKNKTRETVDNLPDFYADISKIKKEIGWQPKTNIKNGIQKMIDYYSSEN